MKQLQKTTLTGSFSLRSQLFFIIRSIKGTTTNCGKMQREPFRQSFCFHPKKKKVHVKKQAKNLNYYMIKHLQLSISS